MNKALVNRYISFMQCYYCENICTFYQILRRMAYLAPLPIVLRLRTPELFHLMHWTHVVKMFPLFCKLQDKGDTRKALRPTKKGFFGNKGERFLFLIFPFFYICCLMFFSFPFFTRFCATRGTFFALRAIFFLPQDFSPPPIKNPVYALVSRAVVVFGHK